MKELNFFKNLSFPLALMIMFSLAFLGKDASAQTAYILKLNYNPQTKVLSFSDPQNKVSLVESTNIPLLDVTERNTTEGPYYLKLYTADGINSSTVEFVPKDGSFSLAIPYYSTVSEVTIEDKTAREVVLRIDLGQYLKCNLNGVCDAGNGENITNCLGDCYEKKIEQKVFEKKQPITETQNEAEKEDISTAGFIAVISIGFIIIATLIYLGYRLYRRK